ncbi:TonB-dependent receptor plug domain-containing protein [Pseudomonas stutzeri]|uniref:TonB-dependent receptor plug domain-containing protein n=2 Tax=Stutzerimonas stutzeri TaxID=316 RepID=UPI0009B7C1D2|nr:TonB-dependent receptor plug domain-containing protein [Stutzerimonas stutzeri]
MTAEARRSPMLSRPHPHRPTSAPSSSTTVAKTAWARPGRSAASRSARNEEMVHVRGFDLRQVPIFVDGIPIYVPYYGYADLSRFTTFDLGWVEVVGLSIDSSSPLASTATRPCASSTRRTRAQPQPCRDHRRHAGAGGGRSLRRLRAVRQRTSASCRCARRSTPSCWSATTTRFAPPQPTITVWRPPS